MRRGKGKLNLRSSFLDPKLRLVFNSTKLVPLTRARSKSPDKLLQLRKSPLTEAIDASIKHDRSKLKELKSELQLSFRPIEEMRLKRNKLNASNIGRRLRLEASSRLSNHETSKLRSSSQAASLRLGLSNDLVYLAVPKYPTRPKKNPTSPNCSKQDLHAKLDFSEVIGSYFDESLAELYQRRR
jgi:hypothetical protein